MLFDFNISETAKYNEPSDDDEWKEAARVLESKLLIYMSHLKLTPLL